MRISILLVLAIGTIAACGGEDTIPLAEWVAEFDATCLEVTEELSDPTLTDAEFAAISNRAADRMRAVPAPDEMAATASQLIDDIAAASDGTRTSAEVEALDQAVLAAMTELGATACLAGAPG